MGSPVNSGYWGRPVEPIDTRLAQLYQSNLRVSGSGRDLKDRYTGADPNPAQVQFSKKAVQVQFKYSEIPLYLSPVQPC